MSGLPFTGFLVPSGGAGGGSGDVTGPASSTDNAIARFNGAGGKTLQDSGILVTDTNELLWEGATADDFETTLGVTDPTADNTILLPDLSGTLVIGPASSTDNAVVKFDSTTGKLLQDSALFVSDGASPQISFGGITSAFPAIRRNTGDTDALDFVLADGSAFNRIYVGEVIDGGSNILLSGVSGYIYFNSSRGLAWGSGGSASTSSNDLFLRRDAAGRLFVASDASITLPASIISADWVEASTAGSGAPNVLAANESGKLLTNEGSTAANYHTLVSAVAGYKYEFFVQDADGMRIVANTGDTIRVIDKVTASAGYIESTTIGSCVVLKAINATEWVAMSVHGVWTDGTFTFDDTGLTSP